MILAPGEFRTLDGPLWRAHLGVARARRKAAAERTVLAVAACTNDACACRAACARFGRASQVTGRWLGGEGCAGFQPRGGQPREGVQ